jgi:hypothetical protein
VVSVLDFIVLVVSLHFEKPFFSGVLIILVFSYMTYDRSLKLICRHIIHISGEVQTFIRNHQRKVGFALYIVFWVSTVVSIEKTISINSVIRNGPRFTASFGQVCANFTIHSHLHALSENVYRFFLWSQLESLSPLSISTCGLG